MKWGSERGKRHSTFQSRLFLCPSHVSKICIVQFCQPGRGGHVKWGECQCKRAREGEGCGRLVGSSDAAKPQNCPRRRSIESGVIYQRVSLRPPSPSPNSSARLPPCENVGTSTQPGLAKQWPNRVRLRWHRKAAKNNSHLDPLLTQQIQEASSDPVCNKGDRATVRKDKPNPPCPLL